MKITEYEQVKDFTYQDYCDYLQNKYGIGTDNYFTKNFTKSKKVTRTSEGLFVHHRCEDLIANLSDKEVAASAPFEYQEKENLVYCDYLEHLFLHILICEYPNEDREEGQMVGIGGIVNFLIPELDTCYSESIATKDWLQRCYDEVLKDKDVYDILRERFVTSNKIHTNYNLTEQELRNSVDGYLLEHNKLTYELMERYLDKDNKALVVLGTGVGKTTTALEYLKRNNYKALVLCPSDIIKAGWNKYKEVDTLTYQAFANKYSTFDYSKYQVLICDEAHHCGGASWGKGPEYVIANNLLKVIGLTATPLRTDGIDIGETLFGGNICKGLSVLDGILEGVLHPFSYVGAIYDTSSIKKEVAKKKNVDEILLGELDLAINNTPAVKEIITSNMPEGARKGIIFVSNIAAIDEAIEIMRDIYPNAEYRAIHSQMPESEVEKNKNWFQNTNEGYLVSINMIAEGAHYKGVNTLIMFRRTCSSLVFDQQLGRVISLAKYENPNAIVFDLTNNAKTIEEFKPFITKLKEKFVQQVNNNNEKELKKSQQIIIKSYCDEISSILNRINIGGSKNRPVICIETQIIYSTLREAHLKTKINGIGNVVIHMAKTAGGYHWAYLDDKKLQELYKEFIGKNPFITHTKQIICIETQEIFNSGAEAGRKFGAINGSVIFEACKTKGFAYKYHWAYLDDKESQLWFQNNTYSNEPNNKQKRVICIDTQIIYNNLQEAANSVNGLKSNISSCCNGKSKSAYGYHWAYYEEGKNYIIEKRIDPRCKKVLCIETNEIFDSLPEAAKAKNVSSSCICNCCNGKAKTCGGYHWKYYEEGGENL